MNGFLVHQKQYSVPRMEWHLASPFQRSCSIIIQEPGTQEKYALTGGDKLGLGRPKGVACMHHPALLLIPASHEQPALTTRMSRKLLQNGHEFCMTVVDC